MRRLRDDSGTSLIFVLVIITVCALGLSALLSFADASLRATVNLRAQATAQYDADGAMQAAVNAIRNSGYNASTGQHCFGASDTLSLPNFDGTTSAAVSCTADPSKVLIQCPSLSQCNRPGTAILTLGRNSEDGIRITQPASGSAFNVHGVVFSNSKINVVKGSLTSNARVYAREACSGTITAVPSASCNYGNTANALGNDPAYAAATSTVPVYRAVPTCTANGSLVTFQPGYYDDAVGLTALMAGNKCKHSTWWFTPGTYYFDFHNNAYNSTNYNPLLSSGADTWTIDDGTLVAGTPVNAAGAVIATPPVPATIPGSCDNPINDPHATGVQFIFGGDSRMSVGAGQVEICGTYSASRPPVAVYGLTSGGETPGSQTLSLNAVPTPGSFGASATVANLANPDNTAYASWKAVKANDSGTMTVSGYAPATPIPAGSRLTSAYLQVRHRHSGSSSTDTVNATITPTGGSALNTTLPGLSTAAGFVTDANTTSMDSGSGPIAQAVYAGTFTGAQIALTFGLKAKNDVEDVDSVQLLLNYIPPALRAAAGCVIVTPYGGGAATGSSCAVISTANGSGGTVYVQGTTYVPGGAVDITLNNAAEQVFRFGVISRTLWVKETGSFTFTGPVIEVPDDSPGFVIAVYLSVCPPGSASCLPGSGVTPVLRAKVAYVDADPSAPVPGQRQVVVLSWNRSG